MRHGDLSYSVSCANRRTAFFFGLPFGIAGESDVFSHFGHGTDLVCSLADEEEPLGDLLWIVVVDTSGVRGSDHTDFNDSILYPLSDMRLSSMMDPNTFYSDIGNRPLPPMHHTSPKQSIT